MKRLLNLVLLLSASTAFFASSESAPLAAPAPQSDDARRNDINAYFNSSNGRRNDNCSALTIKMASPETMPPVIVNSSGAFVIKNYPRDLATVPITDIFAENKTNIFPGSIIYVNKNLADGHPDPVLLGKGRGTVDLTINFNLGKGRKASKKDVPNDKASVWDAILELLNSADNNTTYPIHIGESEKYYSSTNELAWDLNVSASYASATMKVGMKSSSSETKVIGVQDFTQSFYTVSVSNINDRSRFFSKDVTRQDIETAIRERNYTPMGIISSVTYGRRAYVFEECVSSTFKFYSAEAASYKGGFSVDGASSQDLGKSTTNKTRKMFILGSDTPSSGKILTGSQISTAIGSENRAAVGVSNPGIELTYTVNFLASGSDAFTTTTGKYNDTKYIPCPKSVRWEISNRAGGGKGAKAKFRGYYNVIRVFQKGTDSKTGEPIYDYKIEGSEDNGTGGYADYFTFDERCGVSGVKNIPTDDIKNKSQCYIYGRVRYDLWKNPGAGNERCDSGEFDLAGFDSVELYINGYAGAGSDKVYIHSQSFPCPVGKKSSNSKAKN